MRLVIVKMSSPFPVRSAELSNLDFDCMAMSSNTLHHLLRCEVEVAKQQTAEVLRTEVNEYAISHLFTMRPREGSEMWSISKAWYRYQLVCPVLQASEILVL